MLKPRNRLLAGLAIASLAAAPALARDTRSADTVPRANDRALAVASPNAAIFESARVSCEAPGNGKTTGHGQGAGRGGENGQGKGRTCPAKSPG